MHSIRAIHKLLRLLTKDSPEPPQPEHLTEGNVLHSSPIRNIFKLLRLLAKDSSDPPQSRHPTGGKLFVF